MNILLWLLLILLALPGLIIVVIMLMPLSVNIDTMSGNYYAGIFPLAGIRLFLPDDAKPVMEMNLLGFRFRPGRKKIEEKTKVKKPEAGKRKLKFHFNRKVISAIADLFLSFRIRKFHLDIDTGNYIANAYLYPVVWTLNGMMWSKPGFQLNVNFVDRIAVRIEVKNRLIVIAWHALKVVRASRRKK